MSELGPKHLLLVAFAVVVGLVLGGLGPRSEVRALREQVASLDGKACDRQVGREIASVFQGRPWQPPDAGGPPVEEEAHSVDEDERMGPRVQLEPDAPLDAVGEAMELRRTQAQAALREQAGATKEQMASVDAIADAMNDELLGLATEFVGSVTAAGGEPSSHDMMVFAADTLDVLLSAEDQLYAVLDAEQRAAVDEEVTDPLSFVDGRLVEVLSALDAP